MATIAEMLAVAVQNHQAGALQTAEQIYRQILAVDPDHPDAWHLLGVIASQIGRHDLAESYIRRAIEQNQAEPAFFSNLGNALQAQRKFDEAIMSFRRALELKPDDAGTLYNLGIVFKDQQKYEEAAQCFHEAVKRAPDFADAHNNLGNVFQTQKKLDEAAGCFSRAIELNPNLAEAHNNLGRVFQDQNRLADAIACFRDALRLKPDYAIAHYNLGSVLHEEGRYQDAVACYRDAIELNPDYAAAYTNLGMSLTRLDSTKDAIVCYRRAVALTDFYEAYYNLGSALQSEGKVEEAIDCYRRALELRPEYPDAHNNLALLMLGKGEYQRGWTEYEWRWKANKLIDPKFNTSRWNGEPLQNRAILLYAEQGLGDTIQCVRYASLVKTQNPAATVIVECQQQLIKLLARCPYIDQLIAQGDELAVFNVHSPLFSLPLIFGTTVETIPANIPYVFIDHALVEHWRQKLGALSGLRIGINWRGGTNQGPFGKRDVPLEYFAGIAQLPGITLISLQKGAARQDLTDASQPPAIIDLGSQFDIEHGAFMDTAAVMMNLDVVITSDTSVAHLAGALGVPVWLALPFVCDWRWLTERNDNPWYPTMRLFRQKTAGDWADVFEEIRAALEILMAVKGQR